jgi:hypothetical protein
VAVVVWGGGLKEVVCVVDLLDSPVGLYRNAVRFNAAFLRASGDGIYAYLATNDLMLLGQLIL